MTADSSGIELDPTHPRFQQRRAAVADQTMRSRRRKLLFAAGAFVALLLAYAATQSALLDVDEIRVVGAEQTPTELLRSIAGVEVGTPILGLDTGAVESRLLEMPQIRGASASAGWGGVLTIEVVERIGVARIDTPAGTIVVASDGVVIEVHERGLLADPEPPATPGAGTSDTGTSATGTPDTATSDPGTPDTGTSDAELEPLPARVEALPEIAGAMFTTETGRQVPEVLTDAVTVAAALPADVRSVIERIEITVDNLLLRAVGGGEIELGDARDLESKFDAIRAFLAQADLTCLETLNVRAPTVPVIRRTPNC